MTTLLLALAFAAGTTVGLELGRSACGPAILALAGALAGVAVLWRGSGRFRVGCAGVVLGLCGWVHGSLADRAPGPFPGGEGLVRLAVVGASTPHGGRCEVEVLPVGSELRWRLWVDPARCPLAEGQEVWALSRDLSTPARPRWPGDWRGLAGHGAEFEVSQLWLAGGEAESYWGAVARLRDAGDKSARGEPARGFVLAAVLGLPAALPPGERSELRRAGLGHLVAVSGMNVAVAALLLRAPLLRLGLLLGGSTALACALAWLPVAAYVGLTGAAAPAVRAALMFTLVQLGALVGRPAHGMTTLAVAAAVLLAWWPGWARDPGFQLSLAAMAALLKPVAPDEAPPGLLAQSWHVTWATTPIGVMHFGHAAVWGVLSNLLAVPVFTLWVAPLGTIGCLLWPWLGDDVLAPAAWGGRLVLDVAAVVARAPEISVTALAVVATVMLGLWILRPRWRGWVPGPIVCVATIAAVVMMPGGEGPTPPAWFAVGGGRDQALVVPSTGDRLACVHEPNLSPEAWGPMLTGLGYAGVAGLTTRKGGEPPHVAALREQLERDGLWRPTPGCDAAPELMVRKLMKECLARTGQKTAALRAGPECFVDGRWESLAPVHPRLLAGWRWLAGGGSRGVGG